MVDDDMGYEYLPDNQPCEHHLAAAQTWDDHALTAAYMAGRHDERRQQPPQPALERVPDGTYTYRGNVIAVSTIGETYTLGIAEQKPRLKMYVGALPPGWVLYRPVETQKNNEGGQQNAK